MIYITSDQHFGHANIIKYCDRPFDSVQQMDEAMIACWNEVVRPDDTVYVVGDFTLANQEAALKYRKRLVGHKVFMPGSHDRWIHDAGKPKQLTGTPFSEWTGYWIEEIKHKGHYITLCHYSMRSWPRSFHGSLHCYGHSHGRLPPHGRSMDIGVDMNHFYPYSLDEIVSRLTKQERHGD